MAISPSPSHPRYKIDKEYEVLLDKPFVPTDRAKLLKGFHIMGGRAKIEHLEQLGPQHLKLTLNQGIKRQIRLMLYELGYEVERLVRVRIGVLKIGETRPGDWRILTPKEIATLKAPETGPAPPRRFIPRPTPRTAAGAPPPARKDFAAGEKSGPPRNSRPPQRKPVGAPTAVRRAPRPEGKRPANAPQRREQRRAKR